VAALLSPRRVRKAGAPCGWARTCGFTSPDVGKPVRITSLQSVVGGVFNNSDIMQVDYHEEYDVVEIEEQDKEYLLHLKAKTEDRGLRSVENVG
jgi:hypothetical protein